MRVGGGAVASRLTQCHGLTGGLYVHSTVVRAWGPSPQARRMLALMVRMASMPSNSLSSSNHRKRK